MVLTPGSPSPVRARKHPSRATRRTTSLSVGGVSGGRFLFRMKAALHSSGSNMSCAFNLLDAAQLQRLDAAAALEDMKEHFNLPARAIPVNHARGLLQAGHRQVGQQAPFDGLFTLGRFHFPRHNTAGLYKSALAIGQL